MQKSEQINELASAVCIAQTNYNKLVKDATNPFYKSKYADLAACIESVREPLSANGLSVIQTTDVEGDKIIVESILMHKSGQWISGRYLLTPAKERDPQSMGSALTYARRYALTAILGIASEDDDANSASGVGKPAAATPVKPRYEKAPENVTYTNPSQWSKEVTDKAGKVEKDGLKGSAALAAYIPAFNDKHKGKYESVSDFKTDALLLGLIKFVENATPANMI